MGKEIIVSSELVKESANKIAGILEEVKLGNIQIGEGISKVTENWLDDNGKEYDERYNNELKPYLDTLEKDIDAMNKLLNTTAADYARLHDEDAAAVGNK